MTPTEAVDRLRHLLAAGALDLPFAAGGHTSDRFDALDKLAAGEDLSVARLAEAHCDAVAIAGEAGRTLPARALAGVWASRFGGSMLVATQRAGGWHLTGELAFCSGAAHLDLAMVDACLPDGSQQLFAVPLDDGVAVDTAGWRTPALAATGTGRARFDVTVDADAAIGDPDFYLRRPGFWHGAIGVAAVWAGGARAIHSSTVARVDTSNPHAAANVGRTFACITTMSLLLSAAGDDIDRSPDSLGMAEALAIRHVVAAGCRDVIASSQRATGPGPQVFDDTHAQRLADLGLYIEQHHHEADLAELGRSLSPTAGRASAVTTSQESPNSVGC